MCWAFLINGFHEFVHNSVFETKSLNWFLARVFAFLGWLNPYEFWASHTEHHKYTLHPPDDLEVVLPVDLSLKSFLKTGFINPVGLWQTLSKTIRIARGKLQGPWENSLFPDDDGREKRSLVRWARLLLAGHATIILVSIGNALVDAARRHDVRAVLWRMAALPLQQQPARRPAG
jgi:fatty acid desaturase